MKKSRDWRREIRWGGIFDAEDLHRNDNNGEAERSVSPVSHLFGTFLQSNNIDKLWYFLSRLDMHSARTFLRLSRNITRIFGVARRCWKSIDLARLRRLKTRRNFHIWERERERETSFGFAPTNIHTGSPDIINTPMYTPKCGSWALPCERRGDKSQYLDCHSRERWNGN